MSLLDDLRDEGLTVVAEPKWQTWAAPKPSYVDDFHPIGILNHWDAVKGWNIDIYRQNPRLGGQPSYHIAIKTDGTVHLISQGYVYGAGGGDFNVYAAMRDDQVPPPAKVEKTWNGNPWFYAVCLNYWPDGDPIPGPQYNALVKVNAALCRREGWRPVSRVNDHQGWTTRKADISGRWSLAAPSNWELTRFRTDVQRQLGDDMVSRYEPIDEGSEALVEDFEDFVNAKVFTSHTEPGDLVLADSFAAFLNRYTTYVVKPLIASANASAWSKAQVWVRDHVKTAIAAALTAGAVGGASVDEVIAELLRRLAG